MVNGSLDPGLIAVVIDTRYLEYLWHEKFVNCKFPYIVYVESILDLYIIYIVNKRSCPFITIDRDNMHTETCR